MLEPDKAFKRKGLPQRDFISVGKHYYWMSIERKIPENLVANRGFYYVSLNKLCYNRFCTWFLKTHQCFTDIYNKEKPKEGK